MRKGSTVTQLALDTVNMEVKLDYQVIIKTEF